jgi:4-amino-4-deoxy-L-arabinose transferase-like glycosyltransferase
MTTSRSIPQYVAKPFSRRDLGLLLLVVASYLILQVTFLQPPSPRDPSMYLWAAERPTAYTNHQSLRIGMLLPLKGATLLFGFSQAAYYLVPLLSGALLAAATFALGRMLFSPAVGIAASLILMSTPYVLEESCQIYTEQPATALLVTAMVVLFREAKRARHPGQDARRSWLLAGGLLLGWSYLLRETLVLLFPVVLVLWWLEKARWRSMLWVASGALAILAFELTWGFLIHDDPLVRFKSVFSHTTSKPGALGDFMTTDGVVDSNRLWFRLRRLPEHWLLPAPLLGWLMIGLLLLQSLAVAVLRDRRLLFLWLWWALFWIALCVLGFVQPHRHFLPLLPAVLLGGLGSLYVGVRRWGGPGRLLGVALPIVVALVMAALGVRSVAAEFQHNSAWHNPFDELRTWLAREGSQWKRIWSDADTRRVLPMYSRSFAGTELWRGQSLVIEFRAESRSGQRAQRLLPLQLSEEQRTQGLLLLNREAAAGRLFVKTTATRRDIPADWVLRWTSSDGSLLAFGAGVDSFEESVKLGASWTVVQRKSVSKTPGDVAPRPPPVQVQLQRGENATITSRDSASSSRALVPSGRLLRIRILVAAEGSGFVSPSALFQRPGSSELERVQLTGFRMDDEPTWTDFYCQTPGGGADGLRCRLQFQIAGPLHFEIGEAELAQAPQGFTDSSR